MRKISFQLVFLALLFFSSWGAKAQVLYQLDAPNGSERLFLLGTFHRIPAQTKFQIDPIVDSLISVSEVVFSEYFGNAGQPNYLQDLEKLAALSTVGSVQETFSQKETNLIIDHFETEYRLSRKILKKYLKYRPYDFHRMAFRSAFDTQPFDDQIFQKAKFQQKSIVVLDTYDILLRASNLLHRTFDKDWLLGFPNGVNDYKRFYKNLLSAYLDQDDALLWSINLEERKRFGEEYDWLIGGRNQEWLNTYEQQKRTVNFMFAGAAHLIDPKEGLLESFRKKGYRITPLPFQTKY